MRTIPSAWPATAEANSTVTIFDGTKVLGTPTADSSGAWNYTTVALASGTHSLTATATDAAGNTGAASQAVDPVINPTVPDAGAYTGGAHYNLILGR